MISVTIIQMITDIASDCPNQRYADTNAYAEQLASVPADISKPSGAMVIVAAMPNTVLIAIARRIFTILLPDRKAFPLTAVNATKQIISASTAAQLTRNLRKLFVLFICVFLQ